jgi:hypothetical protein
MAGLAGEFSATATRVWQDLERSGEGPLTNRRLFRIPKIVPRQLQNEARHGGHRLLPRSGLIFLILSGPQLDVGCMTESC